MLTKKDKCIIWLRDWWYARKGFIRVVAYDGDFLADPFYSPVVPRPGDIVQLGDWEAWEVTEVSWIAVKWNRRCYAHITVKEYSGPRA